MADKFHLHLFTAETPVDGEAVTLVRLLDAGLDYLHVRKPGCNEERVEALLSEIPIRHRHRIIMHDFPSLALKYGCGVQFNSRITSVDRRPVVSGAGCHSLAELDKWRDVDFVTLSPVFDSISKPGYQAAFTQSELEKVSLDHVVALGGVALESLPALSRMGFSGAALLGDVWHRPDGVPRFLKYLRMRNFALQFITDGRDVATTVTQARVVLDAGCRWIQVRMKNACADEVREALQELLPECEEAGATLIVDDHYDLARYCHGVHLGQNDAPVAVARDSISPEAIIGLTVNSREQVSASLSALPDYYGVGPYRFTSTKKNLAPVLGLAGYRSITPEIPRPFVAIGGIQPEDIRPLLEAGASGVAVSSVITRAENPYIETKKLIDIIYGK